MESPIFSVPWSTRIVATDAAPSVQFGFDDGSRRGRARIGLRLDFGIGDQQDLFQQVIQSELFFGRDFDRLHFAAVGFRHDIVLGELRQNAGRVRAFFVNFVDGDDDRDTCRFGMIDRFNGLRHDAVIGGDDQDGNVRHLSATRPHRGKRFMAGRVQKRDLALLAGVLGIVHFDLIGADMLRDAAELARRRLSPDGSRRAATFCRGRHGP